MAIRALALCATLASWAAAATLPTCRDASGVPRSVRDEGAACDAAISSNGVVTGTDDTTAIQAALDAAPPGATVGIPSGRLCKIGGKLTLKNGVRLEGEGGAGLVLSTRQCTGGNFVGSECDSDGECWNGGASTAGLCAGTKFAATAGVAYPVIDASSTGDKRFIGVVGVTIHAMQLSPYYTCTAGPRAGLTCTTDDTNANTGCPSVGTCSGNPRWPSGPGKIDPIDLSNAFATLARIDRNRVVDLRVFDFIFKGPGEITNNTGPGAPTGGICCGPSTGCANTPPGSAPRGSCEANYILSAQPAYAGLEGIVLTSGGRVANNTIASTTQTGIAVTAAPRALIRENALTMSGGTAMTGIRVDAGASGSLIDGNSITIATTGATTVAGIAIGSLGVQAIHNAVTLNGTPASSSNVGIQLTSTIAASNDTIGHNTIATSLTDAHSAGIVLSGGQNRINHNQVSSYTCIKGFGGNVNIDHNRCLMGDGPKIVVSNAGMKISNNYFAWGRSNPVMVIGDTTSGAQTVGTQHAEIDGNTFHTQAASPTFVSLPDLGKRCMPANLADFGGTRAYLSCTTDDDDASTGCPPSNPGNRCLGQMHTELRFTNNEMVSSASKYIDLSALTSAGNTSITSMVVLGNVFGQGGTTGIDFPASSTKIAGVDVSSNSFGTVKTPIDADWSWSYGNLGTSNSPPISLTSTVVNQGSAANGAQVYCSDCDDFARSGGSGALLTRVDGTWVAQTADRPLTGMRHWTLQKVDDIGGTPSLDATGIDESVNTATGTATDLVDTTGTYVDYTSAAANPSDAGWISSRFAITRTNQSPVFTAVIKSGAEAVSTTTRWFVGLASATPLRAKAPTVHAAGFAFDTTGKADTSWECMTCNGTTCTNADTGVSYAPDTRYVLQVACTATQCDCIVNGVLRVSNTGSLPASTQNLGYTVQVRTLAASARAARISKVDLLHR